MIAALGMYDRPETAAANDALWSLIRSELTFGPETLSRDMDFWDIWRAEDLLFAQTCGLPYRARLHDRVGLIGSPVYDIPDCPDGHYYSVLVAHKSNEGRLLSDFSGSTFAYNEALSQSGWAAPTQHMAKAGMAPGKLLETEAHRNSAIAVAEGRADLAGLDVVTWQLIQRYDDFAADLVVIDQTVPTPVLPYITASGQDTDALFTAVENAISALSEADKAALYLKGITKIAKSDYLAQPIPVSPEDFDLAPLVD